MIAWLVVRGESREYDIRAAARDERGRAILAGLDVAEEVNVYLLGRINQMFVTFLHRKKLNKHVYIAVAYYRSSLSLRK